MTFRLHSGHLFSIDAKTDAKTGDVPNERSFRSASNRYRNQERTRFERSVDGGIDRCALDQSQPLLHIQMAHDRVEPGGISSRPQADRNVISLSPSRWSVDPKMASPSDAEHLARCAKRHDKGRFGIGAFHAILFVPGDRKC